MFVVRSYLLFTVYLFTVGVKFALFGGGGRVASHQAKAERYPKGIGRKDWKSERTIKRLTVALSEAKNLDAIKDVSEILRFALDDKMVWHGYYDTASLFIA